MSHRALRQLGACGFIGASILWVSVAVFSQSATSLDIDEGGRSFQNICANCHGPDGDQIAGINFGLGLFRRPFSDQDLIGIIRNGIPGTPMPGSNMSAEQAARIVAYLRSVAASARSGSTSGNAQHGRAIFEGKGACLSCHRINGIGSRIGPDLSEIGQFRRTTDLERSITDPDNEILGQNRFYRVVDATGVTTTGRLLNLDTFSVQMLDTKEQLRSFVKSNLREHGFIEKSPMPSYEGKLTAEELADVVTFLRSLKGAR